MTGAWAKRSTADYQAEDFKDSVRSVHSLGPACSVRRGKQADTSRFKPLAGLYDVNE